MEPLFLSCLYLTIFEHKPGILKVKVCCDTIKENM